MKILFIGDIVGRLGRKTAAKIIPKLKKRHKIDLAAANAENAAHGSGITENIIKELSRANIDLFTLGDHAFKNKIDPDPYLQKNIIRPANFPPGAPGRGSTVIKVNGKNILFISLIGRVFLKMDYDCPFRKLDEILANNNLPENDIFAIIVDIHAETTSEKQCLKHYADGRISALLGTHTHVQTADAEITDKKTAYITDLGMTGYRDGSLGVEASGLIKTYLTQIKEKHVLPEKGRSILSGVILDLNGNNGKARAIKPVNEYITIK